MSECSAKPLIRIGRSGTKVADFGPGPMCSTSEYNSHSASSFKAAHNEHEDHDKDLIPGNADVMLYRLRTPMLGSDHRVACYVGLRQAMDQYRLAMDQRPNSSLSRHSDIPVRAVFWTGAGVLARTLEPGDMLLVEGNTRLSAVIKYLTQSTWSHAALYIGDALGPPGREGEPKVCSKPRLDPASGRYRCRNLRISTRAFADRSGSP